MLKDRFFQLADFLTAQLTGREVLLANYSAEDSAFVRFNRSAVRQPGSVNQQSITIDLIDGRRHAGATLTLSGDTAADQHRLSALLGKLREQLPYLPDDPHLLYNETPTSSDRVGENRLPAANDALDAVLTAGKGRDLVGIWASGGVYRGFANSLGQRNWFENYSFNLDWSFYHQADKAVKTDFAGTQWDDAAFDRKVNMAAQQLAALKQPARSVKPGRYRVFLSPNAVKDVVGMLGWGGVGLKSQRTRRSTLIKLFDGEVALNDGVTVKEHTAAGVGPDFQSEGYLRPPSVTLIDHGRAAHSLVSPRSAREYNVPTNGASTSESPEALEMSTGSLPADDALAALGNGVQVNNVWYLNFSDRAGCRVTGMTRFATFLVENGEIVAPLNVMRWDETIYRVLGSQLEALTDTAEMKLFNSRS
ncbi:MAG: metallopeptidase TldD-related protein, partial [Planctomycetota bacterium]